MNKLNNIIKQLLKLIEKAIDSNYYSQPLPSEIDIKLRKILIELIDIEGDQLKMLIGVIEGDNASVLTLFSERMASLAVRKKNINIVEQGLSALIISSYGRDSREILLILSLLHDAILKNGGNPKELFCEAYSIFGREELLKNYLSGNEKEKSIEVMGYKESKNIEGFLYVRTW